MTDSQDTAGVVVEGWLQVDPDERDDFLTASVEVVRAARDADGCLGFHMGADLLRDDRVVVLEVWTSAEAVDAFRGDGPSGGQAAAILDADVRQHRIADTRTL